MFELAFKNIATGNEMRGYLVIHVGGFKYVTSGMVHVYSTEGGHAAIPDRLFPAGKHDPDTTEWTDEGWAVGENARDRFCKWRGSKPMKRFRNYDEAVTFIQRLRQRRKARKEAYTLVYVYQGRDKKDQYRPVSFLDDILAIDREIDGDKASREAAYKEHYPEIDVLTDRHGPAMAHQLSALLAAIRKNGMQKAMEGISKATFYRHVRHLKDAGILE